MSAYEVAQQESYKVNGCTDSLRSKSVDLQPLLLLKAYVVQEIQDATHVVMEVEDGDRPRRSNVLVVMLAHTLSIYHLPFQ